MIRETASTAEFKPGNISLILLELHAYTLTPARWPDLSESGYPVCETAGKHFIVSNVGNFERSATG